MGNGSAVVERFTPAGAGGLTMLLVGLCSKLPPEDQQFWILVASFAGPIVSHICISATHRYMVPTQLAVYKKALKSDIADAKEGLRHLQEGSEQHKKLQDVLMSTHVLLATASQDYYSGKISIKRAGGPDPSQPVPPTQ